MHIAAVRRDFEFMNLTGPAFWPASRHGAMSPVLATCSSSGDDQYRPTADFHARRQVAVYSRRAG